MSLSQRFFKFIFPASWAKSMERESREWKVICPCGYRISVWELGGIRWKAAGNKRIYRRCSKCGERAWMAVKRDTPSQST